MGIRWPSNNQRRDKYLRGRDASNGTSDAIARNIRQKEERSNGMRFLVLKEYKKQLESNSKEVAVQAAKKVFDQINEATYHGKYLDVMFYEWIAKYDRDNNIKSTPSSKDDSRDDGR